MKKGKILFLAAALALAGCSVGGVPASVASTEGVQVGDELALAPGEPCPVSPIIEDFWDGAGPFAGAYPVWMTTLDRQPWRDRDILPNVLPPSNGFLVFDYGFVTKALVAVSQEVEGDLTITGHQLDGGGVVYFPQDDELQRVSDTELQLVAPPPQQMVIEDAQVQSRSPNPPGMAHHGMGYMVTGPGCYAFDLHIGEHTTTVVMEFYE